MPFVDFARMPDDEAERFAQRYLSEREARLSWFAERTGLVLDPSRECLASAWRWIKTWWENGGADAVGEEYPMWWVPGPSEGITNGPALLMADGAGYVFLDSMRARVPWIELRRCSDRTISYNQPVLWINEDLYTCPFGLAYTCLLRLKKAKPAQGIKPAGSDPEALAKWADVWTERATRVRSS